MNKEHDWDNMSLNEACFIGDLEHHFESAADDTERSKLIEHLRQFLVANGPKPQITETQFGTITIAASGGITLS